MPLTRAPVSGGVIARIQAILTARRVTKEAFRQKTGWSLASINRLFDQGIASPADIVPAILVIQELAGLGRQELLQDVIVGAAPDSKEILLRAVVTRMAKEGVTADRLAKRLGVERGQLDQVLDGEKPPQQITAPLAKWLGITQAQLTGLAKLQRQRRAAPQTPAGVPPLSSLIVAACDELTQKARTDASERSLRSSASRSSGSRHEKAARAAHRAPDYSPSSWARKHGLSIRVISSLANGGQISKRSIRFGNRLAKLLGVDGATFWIAAKKNRLFPKNGHSEEIRRRLVEAFNASAKKRRTPETIKAFATRVGVRHDTLSSLMQSGILAGMQVVNRERIRQFLHMDHDEWANAITDGPAGTAKRRTKATADETERRLLSLWRKASTIAGGIEMRRRLLAEMAEFLG